MATPSQTFATQYLQKTFGIQTIQLFKSTNNTEITTIFDNTAHRDAFHKIIECPENLTNIVNGIHNMINVEKNSRMAERFKGLQCNSVRVDNPGYKGRPYLCLIIS